MTLGELSNLGHHFANGQCEEVALCYLQSGLPSAWHRVVSDSCLSGHLCLTAARSPEEQTAYELRGHVVKLERLCVSSEDLLISANGQKGL